MKILVGVSHPKHVYMFKNFIFGMIEKGHEIKIVAVERERIIEYLLRRFDLPYEFIGKIQSDIYKKMLCLPKWDYATLRIAKRFKPDIFIGQAHVNLAHVSALLRKPFILFEDTESATVLQKLCLPFTNAVVTPSCYRGDFGKKHVRFNGYYELAYLHPNYFKPDPAVLGEVNLSKDDKFIIMRFSSFNAIHDIGIRGFGLNTEVVTFIKKLEEYGRVFLTSEKKLGKELEKYKLKISPEEIHNLLYFSTMYVGEGATMASEAGVLGVPSIFVYSYRLGYLDDLQKYGLTYSFTNREEAVAKAFELLERNELRKEWKKKREKLLSEKIDVTRFMTEFIENYPESFYEYKRET